MRILVNVTFHQPPQNSYIKIMTTLHLVVQVQGSGVERPGTLAPAKTSQNVCCQKGLVILNQKLMMSSATFVLPEHFIQHNGALYWAFDDDNDDAVLLMIKSHSKCKKLQCHLN